jgi:hypothetical protein
MVFENGRLGVIGTGGALRLALSAAGTAGAAV